MGWLGIDPGFFSKQFYVGMRIDQNGAVTFDYGAVATQVVGLILGVPTETSAGPPGDLLEAINGRTFTADTPETQNLERSTLLVDHTFVKGQRDNGHPAATSAAVGNVSCGP